MKTALRAICAAVLLCLIAFSVSAQVPVSLSPTIRQQYFSASGVPLAGGFIAVYVAGTSIPSPIYLDSSGGAQNTNPAPLDSGGFISLWLPSTPVDIAVFNSSMTQQYKVLNVTALPSTVTSLTANFFQSTTANPALSGFLRMASTDQACWRNNGNSADLCISKNTSDSLLFVGNPFAYTNLTQEWGGIQTFAGLAFTNGFPFVLTFTAFPTANHTIAFPDAGGTVCLSANDVCFLTDPTINGTMITNAPTGPGQVLTSTSPTSAGWGQAGSIVDYDNYTGFALFGVTPPTTNTIATIPIGAVQAANPVGSFIEGEIEISAVTYTGSAPVFQLNINGAQIGANFNLSVSTSYDIKFTLALSSSKAPQAVESYTTSGAAAQSFFTGGLATIDGTAPIVIGYTITTASAVSLTGQFVHVRVRN